MKTKLDYVSTFEAHLQSSFLFLSYLLNPVAKGANLSSRQAIIEDRNVIFWI